MSDATCVNCVHGPHRDRTCSVCVCDNFQNAAVVTARACANTNNLLMSEIPMIKALLVNVLEILVETNPAAVERIDAKREILRRELEEQAATKEEEQCSEVGGKS